MGYQVTINGKDGKPLWYADVTEESIHLEYEIYGSGGQPDLESNNKIPSSEFFKIRERFNFDQDTPMSTVLIKISESGRGDEFQQMLDNKEIKVDSFVWWSFPFDD